jgi:hypothetical protein
VIFSGGKSVAWFDLEFLFIPLFPFPPVFAIISNKKISFSAPEEINIFQTEKSVLLALLHFRYPFPLVSF